MSNDLVGKSYCRLRIVMLTRKLLHKETRQGIRSYFVIGPTAIYCFLGEIEDMDDLWFKWDVM